MTFIETIPPWKMPADEKISHQHRVSLRINPKREKFCWSVDLREFYLWADDNDMEIEHNIMRSGDHLVPAIIMFTFWSIEDAMAFKLRWR